MSMFGNRKRPFGMPDYTTTQGVMGMGVGGGIGGGLPGGSGDLVMASLPVDTYAGERPQNPGFFQKGGMGGKLAFGALGGALDGVAHFGGMDGGFTAGLQANQKAQQEWQQRIALEQYKRQNPEPTTLQRNADYLATQNPAFKDTYLRAEANPMSMMVDQATGQPRFYPKAGIPTVTDQTGWDALKSGDQFMDPNGNVRRKP